MPSTRISQREVFCRISQAHHKDWPAYRSTPMYDRSSLGGLEEDVRTVAKSGSDTTLISQSRRFDIAVYD